MEKWTLLVLAVLFTVTVQKSIKIHQDENKLEDDADYTFNLKQQYGENCSCNWRFLLHYETKGCRPVEEDSCGCPTKFDCPNVNEVDENNRVCIYKGREYPIGSRINTSNLCQVCRCSDVSSKAGIVCRPIECPVVIPEPGCHLIYDNRKCCPIKTVCDQAEGDSELNAPETFCEYGNRLYPLGARVYPDEDPCLICTCTEGLSAFRSFTCYYQDCILGRNKVQQGCIPIYHEKTCCPIEFYCPSSEKSSYENRTTEPVLKDAMCVFDGQYYKIGEALPVNHLSKCVSCTCQVPPDFTCIHQSCPPSPNVENCEPYYLEDFCCPQYDCAIGDSMSANITSTSEDFERREMEGDDITELPVDKDNPCFGVNCEDETEKCVLYKVACNNESCPPVPTCMKINNNCSVPRCEPGCVVIEHDENNCPECACGEEIEKRSLRCQMPQCTGQNCRLVAGENRCPECSCDEACVNECPPGCNVLSEIEGNCPKCICEDENEGCPTPVCEHEGCRIEAPPGGCPTCICDRRGVTEKEVNEFEQQVYNAQSQHNNENILPTQNYALNNDYDSIVVMPRTFFDNSSIKDVKLVKREMESDDPSLSSFTYKQSETKVDAQEIQDNTENLNDKDRNEGKIDKVFHNSEKDNNNEFKSSMCPPVECNGFDCETVKFGFCDICMCKYRCPPPQCGENCIMRENGKDKCPSCVCYIV